MPTFDYRCPNGHLEESRYVARHDQAHTLICYTCGQPTVKQFSPAGGRMLFFEEGRARHLKNLDGGPGGITSHAQHERLQREQGRTSATKDDLLHSQTSDSIRKAQRKRDEQNREKGWMRQYVNRDLGSF